MLRCADISIFFLSSSSRAYLFFFFFFFNDTATTEIYTLSLHDALPISWSSAGWYAVAHPGNCPVPRDRSTAASAPRSEEHTSELQSLAYLVCRLLLEKKKKKIQRQIPHQHTVCVSTMRYADAK